MSATSEESEHLPIHLANRGAALAEHYQRTGSLGDLDGAIAAYRQAVQTVPVNSLDRPEFLTGLGHTLRSRYDNTRERSDLDEAIRLYEEALDATPPESPERARRLSSLANGLGDRYDESNELSDLDRAIDLYRAALRLTPANSPDRPGFSSNLGGSLSERYERTGGRDDLGEAIGLFEETVNSTPRSSPRLPGFRNNLAMGLRLRYLLDGSEEDLRAAVDHYKQSCKLGGVSEPRAVLVSATRWGQWATERKAWSEAAEAYGYGLDAAQRLVGLQFSRSEKETWLRLTKRLAPGSAYSLTMTGKLEEAVIALERGRAVLLAEALEQGSGQTVPTLSFDVIAAEAQTTPLVYVVAAASGGVALIVGTDGVVEAVLLPGLTQNALRDQAADYFEAYVARTTDRARWTAALDDLGQWLWQHVMGIVLRAVPASDEVVLIPGGYLGLLPLHAAWTGDPTTPTGRRYALDCVRISYSANARALAAARRMAADVTPDSILIVEQPLPVDAPSLPNAEAEAAAVEHIFASSQPLVEDDPITQLKHGNATRAAVKGALIRYAVLHLCCHGFADPGEPLSGGLIMANNEVLTVRDVMERRETPARLAVLSACETARPGADLPDEVMGLPTGLVEAGVAGVIGSLWSVPDLGTAVLITRFYELWRTDGLEPSEALRQAQRWVRDATNAQLRDRFPREFERHRLLAADRAAWEAERPFTHPGSWAAFTYTGA